MLKSDYTIVAQELTRKYVDFISGRDEHALIGHKPSEIAMIGMIKAEQVSTSLTSNNLFDATGYESVPSVGLTFHVLKDTNKLNIKLRGQLYYRVKPNYSQQEQYLLKKYSKKEKVHFYTVKDLLDYYDERNQRTGENYPNEDLMYLYKCIYLNQVLENYTLDLNDLEHSLEVINNEVSYKLKDACDIVFEKSISVKNTGRSLNKILNENEFNIMVNANVVNIRPTWELKLICKVSDLKDYKEVTLQIINKTKKIENKETFETTLFDAGIEVSSKTNFLPIRLNSIKHDYLNPTEIYAVGVNCAVDYTNPSILKTTNIPIFIQNRVKTIDEYDEYIKFDRLIADPIYNLNKIKLGLEERLSKYKQEMLELSNTKEQNWLKKFSEEIDNFKHEIKRFEDGIYLIERKSEVKKAFELMNESFSSNAKYSGWRLFQIVFIVSEINDIVYSEYFGKINFYKNDSIDLVDMLYFPTGGGKTEAFLGCVIFTAFFDRLRGKAKGVSAFIKYPLRLLSAQQLDRVLNISMKANEIKNNEKIEGQKFTVGFYTGSQNTPNKIDKAYQAEMETWTQEKLDTTHRQIDKCPVCGGDIHITFDKQKWLLVHKCQKCGVLPILIVDDDLYRFPPTIVISTIDKLANLGTSSGFKSLLGKKYGVCSIHGNVFMSSGKCGCPECKGSISDEVVKDPVPTLFIQDELHLVNESLGTFDSHYEGFLQYYCEDLIGENLKKKIKYIGATATISEFEEHCKNLYYKNGVCFPNNVKGQNFYSYIDKEDLNRIIIGAALYGGSITDCLRKAISYFRKVIYDIINNKSSVLIGLKEKGFSGDENTIENILNDYLISILYNNSKDDASKLQAALQNQGNNYLNDENIPPFKFGPITGDVDFTEIKSIMHKIQSTEKKVDAENMIIATSAISHGVDVDSFNHMFFFGMPNKTSEYIQAYSRVGRKYTGIVFDVIRLMRDRDKSFLKNFDGYHRYKDLLVEPVPINRWAKNAIYSTLPGIVAAYLLQYASNDYNALKVTKKIDSGLITLEKMIYDIKRIYKCNDLESNSKLYSEIIEKEVSEIFNGFKVNISPKSNIGEVIAKNNSKRKYPMTSLRDVDTALEVALKGV